MWSAKPSPVYTGCSLFNGRQLPHPGKGHDQATAAATASVLSTAVTPCGTQAPRSELRMLSQMSPSQISDVIHLLACHRHQPSNSWVKRYVDASMHKLPYLRPRQLARVIRSVVALDLHPGEEWLEQFDSACYLHPGPFDSTSTTEVLTSMAQLPDVQYRFPTAVHLKLSNNCSDFSYAELCCILRGLKQLGVDTDEEFEDMIGRRMGLLLLEMGQDELSTAVELSVPELESCQAGG